MHHLAIFFLVILYIIFQNGKAAHAEEAPKGDSPEQQQALEEIEIQREVYDLTAEPKVGRIKLSWEYDENDVDHFDIYGRYFNDENWWLYDGFHWGTRAVELPMDPLCEARLKVVTIRSDGTVSLGAEVKSTARHKNVVIDHCKERKLLIYLPDGYHEESRDYPVIYMHDGQNLFSPRLSFVGEWHVDDAMDRLIAKGKIDKCIVAGIYNSSKRAEEYTPFADRRFGGGKAREFSRFITKEIIPYVESKYRVSRKREDRAVMGSSFGGIISLWMAYTYPEVFSMAAAISPSLWIADGAMLDYLERTPKRDIKIWIDQGTFEWSDFTRNTVKLLADKGYEYGRELLYYEVKDAEHSERYWSERVECPLIFFKGKPAGKLKRIRLDTEIIRMFSIGPHRIVVNPVGFFENGSWYSLYNLAEYSIEGKSKANIDETGILQFNNAPDATVTVRYRDLKETVTIINPFYEPPKAEPKKVTDIIKNIGIIFEKADEIHEAVKKGMNVDKMKKVRQTEKKMVKKRERSTVKDMIKKEKGKKATEKSFLTPEKIDDKRKEVLKAKAKKVDKVMSVFGQILEKDKKE